MRIRASIVGAEKMNPFDLVTSLCANALLRDHTVAVFHRETAILC